MAPIGDTVYLMGRSQLLQWLNDLTGLGYTKVEECASGAAICQVFHSLYPNDINLRRVNFKSRLEYEHVQNFKLLQACFRKLRIDKHIPIEKLIKGKYQDNLEFLQWVKSYFDRHSSSVNNYDGVAVRDNLGIDYRANTNGNGKTMQRRMKNVHNIQGKVGGTSGINAHVGRNDKNFGGFNGMGNKRTAMRGKESNHMGGAIGIQGKYRMGIAEKKELEELRVSVQDMQITIEDLEKERDFYFNKLRDVEILIQTHESENPGVPLDGILATIQSVLYATEEEDEALQDQVHQQVAQDEIENHLVVVDDHGQEIIEDNQVTGHEQDAYDEQATQLAYEEQDEYHEPQQVYSQ